MMSPIPTAFRTPQEGLPPLPGPEPESIPGEFEQAEDFTSPIPLADPATADLPHSAQDGAASAAPDSPAPAIHSENASHAGEDPPPEPSPGMADALAVPAPPETGTVPELLIGPGTLLRERYRLDSQIGAGGSSLIFRAIDLHRQGAGSTTAFVAIKLLKPEFRSVPEASDRLKREFYRLEILSHPHIGRAFDLDHDGNVWFLALELLDGLSLSGMFGRQIPLDRREALRIIQACGDALQFAHAHGILHCDFKPGNILVTQTDEIKVIDFGSGFDQFLPITATLPSATRTRRHATAAYASPEALAGKDPDVRDDVFSFAAVVYELLTGKRPYAANPDSASSVPSRPSGLRNRQWKVLLQALSPTEAGRLASVEPLVEVLKPRRQLTRNWAIAALLACIAGALLLLATRPRVELNPLPALPVAVVPANEAANETPQPQSGAASDPATDTAGEAIQPVAPPARTTSTNIPAPETTLITLDRSELIISRPTTMAAMILQRTGGPARRALVRWRTIPGTAMPGVDYMSVSEGVVNFADNQNISALYVPLLTREGLTEDRTFQIEITTTSRQVDVGPIARVTVTIRG